MSSHGKRPSRPLQSSVSVSHSSGLLQSTLQPSGFLNMLNPMRGRAYQGYIRADQSVLEEDEGEDNEDVEGAGDNIPFRSNRGVSWGESSQMTALRQPDERQLSAQGADSSDDEVPQSFMIEPSHAKSSPRFTKNNRTSAKRHSSTKPLLPISIEDGLSLPPRPSEIDPPTEVEPEVEIARKQMRGLDAYERALWNWINVYDLDVYLQDVYRYYEGKGIISIALARGLHLL